MSANYSRILVFIAGILFITGTLKDKYFPFKLLNHWHSLCTAINCLQQHKTQAKRHQRPLSPRKSLHLWLWQFVVTVVLPFCGWCLSVYGRREQATQERHSWSFRDLILWTAGIPLQEDFQGMCFALLCPRPSTWSPGRSRSLTLWENGDICFG